MVCWTDGMEEHGQGRFDAVVQRLREWQSDERVARERRRKLYRQHLQSDVADLATSASARPDRLERVQGRVPCRISAAARDRLAWLRRAFPGATVSIARTDSESQSLILTARGGGEERTVGRIENRVAADPDAPDHGVTIDLDDHSTLVVRFWCRAASPIGGESSGTEIARTDHSPADLPCRQAGATAAAFFTETRSALEPRTHDRIASPRIACTMRSHELAMMRALESRELDAFYARFKREVLSGIWGSLHAVLATMPRSVWHKGAHYTAIRTSDAGIGRICQTTVDDTGATADVGANRIYDACSATDILLLYLDGDVLADLAAIYFRLHGLDSPHALALREEFFSAIRRFWSASDALASRYAADRPAVLRISQRAQPMPAQVSLLERDWIDLRQILVDRYGADGRKAASLSPRGAPRNRDSLLQWPFASFAPGEVNIGLRLVYRQEWRTAAALRGSVIRTVRACDDCSTVGHELVESRIIDDGSSRDVEAIVHDAVTAATTAMSWARDMEGSFNVGNRSLACPIVTAPIAELMTRIASRPVDAPAIEDESSGAEDATRAWHRLQHRFDVVTRIAAIQHVVLVGEQLPAPMAIGLSWVRRHHDALRRELLDESLREALDTISADGDVARQPERERLFEHVRANILTYQRAIWQGEDPHQRLLRYRKLGRRVPVDWLAELHAGAQITIDALEERLLGTEIDVQFVTYATSAHVSLDELIDPVGPIGFHGNYAVYRMQPSFAAAGAFAPLRFFAAEYASVAEQATHRTQVAIDTGGLVMDVLRPRVEPVAGLIAFDQPAILATPARPALALRMPRSAAPPSSIAGGRLLIASGDHRKIGEVPSIRPSRRRTEITLDHWAGMPFDGSLVIGAAQLGRPRPARGIPLLAGAAGRKEKPVLLAGRSAGPLLLASGDTSLRPSQLARDDEQAFAGR
jgi:hypothetical protein